MNTFLLVTLADFRESVRAKWFLMYFLIFGGAVVLLFVLGITESRVMGFTGLSRLLITYIQLCVAILPILILISTVRSVVGDRESNILEYFLSMPISLTAYFWGKILSRFFLIFIPISTALLGAVIWGMAKGLAIPWQIGGYYSILLGTLSWCFLGIGMFISTLVKKQEWGLGLSILIWLVLLLFIDVILIGLMLQQQLMESVIVAISLLNPIMVFRTGAVLLFDPELTSLGPASYVILDNMGYGGFLAYTILYPLSLGWIFSWLGFSRFKKGDLV
ncbi:MAG: ABC transporter permease subunit [Desulfobulbaceae bacterium]|nr:ABC transporter permease subunit [Desulfobulbaceae bacterium]